MLDEARARIDAAVRPIDRIERVSLADADGRVLAEEVTAATLVGTVLTQDPSLIAAAGASVDIDRLNVGPIPTNRLNWLQPHEGNIIDFLFRSRAYQVADMPVAAH